MRTDAAPLRGRRGGFVLVSVLAVLAVLAALASAVMLVGRSAAGSARVVVDGLIEDALTRAGIEIAAYQLTIGRYRPIDVDGQQIRFDDGLVTLFAERTDDRIDLNQASPELLAALWRGAGQKRLSPEAFAGRVVDWRDGDDVTSDEGAEVRDYDAAGLAYEPANAEFRSVDDLRWVLGLRAEDVRALKPYLTVANPAGAPNVLSASPELLALLGVPARQVKRLVAVRGELTPAATTLAEEIATEREGLLVAEASPGPLVRVRVEVRPARGVPRMTEVTLTRDPTGREPYLVVDRRVVTSTATAPRPSGSAG